MYENEKQQATHKADDMTNYAKWMLLLSYLDSDNEDMFEDELIEVICG